MWALSGTSPVTLRTAEHVIAIDHARLLVEVRLAGFFNPLQAAHATDEVRAAIRTLGDRVGQHVTLYDASGIDVAPAATVELLKGAYADPAIRHLWARRVAYVSPSALMRIQLKRLRAARADIGIFAEREAALDYLLGER